MGDAKAARCPQYTAAFAATCGAFAMGAFLGWSSQAQPKITDISKSADNYGFEVNDEDFSWIGSAFTLGAACVCIPIGIIINITGRKWTMLFLVIPFTISWLMIIFPTNLIMLIVGRFIGGAAGGAFCIAAPIYTAEISENEIRGTTGFMFQLNITLGILFAYIIGGLCNLMLYNFICACIPIVFAIFFFLMPESPLFLLYRDKQEAAKKAMAFLRGKNYSYDGELADMQSAIAKDAITVNPFKNIAGFKRRATVKGFIVCLGLMFFQQFCGINVVIFYSTDIFGGVSGGLNKQYSTMIIGIVQVIATFISTMIVDKVGRRILLMLSDFVMALCTIVLGGYFFMEHNDPESVENIGLLPILSVCLFIIMFSFGFGPIPWLMVGELFAPDVKGLCGALGGTFNWLLAFVVTKLFTTFRATLGEAGTFWLYSLFSLIGTVFVFFLVPETKNISLEMIQQKLES